MAHRDAILAYLRQAGISTPRANASIDKLLQEHAHKLGEQLRNVHASGEGASWNWWDAAEIPGACADLIDPPGAVVPDDAALDRVICPACQAPQRVNSDRRMRRHGDADRPCAGSGAFVSDEAAS